MLPIVTTMTRMILKLKMMPVISVLGMLHLERPDCMVAVKNILMTIKLTRIKVKK